MGIMSGPDRRKRIRCRMQKQEMHCRMQRGIFFKETTNKMRKEERSIHVDKHRHLHQGRVNIFSLKSINLHIRFN